MLKKIKKRRRRKKSFLLGKLIFKTALLLIVFYLLLKSAIGSLYLASRFVPKKEIEIKKTITPALIPSLEVFNIPQATNEAQIKVILSVVNVKSLKAYLNNKPVNTIPVEDESVEVKVKNLKLGKNSLFFIGEINKQEVKSKKYIVVYDKTPPKLKLNIPDNFETSEKQIEIKGETEANTILKINSIPIVVLKDGTFSTTLTLKEGENKILITAKDKAGNIAEKKLTIIKTSQKD